MIRDQTLLSDAIITSTGRKHIKRIVGRTAALCSFSSWEILPLLKSLIDLPTPLNKLTGQIDTGDFLFFVWTPLVATPASPSENEVEIDQTNLLLTKPIY